MAIRIVLVDKDGNPATIMSPGTNDMYENGSTYGDYVAWHLPFNEAPSTFLATKYFDFDLNDFATRNERPSEFHNWNKRLKQWEFDFTRALEWVRIQRNKLLLATDWTQLADSPLSEQQKITVQSYRQALRDLPDNIPNTIQNIDQITWPSAPA